MTNFSPSVTARINESFRNIILMSQSHTSFLKLYIKHLEEDFVNPA